MEKITEITNEKCLGCIRRPFPIGDVVVFIHIKAKFLSSLVRSAWVLGMNMIHELC